MDTDAIIIGAAAGLAVIHGLQRAIPALEVWADSDGDHDDLDSRAVRMLRRVCGVLAPTLEFLVGRRG